MAMMDYEKSKFRFSETFNNSDGKTSGSGFIGVLIGLTAILGFVAGTIGVYFKLPNIMELVDASIQFALLGGGLLGLRKATGVFSSGRTTNIDQNIKNDPEPEEKG